MSETFKARRAGGICAHIIDCGGLTINVLFKKIAMAYKQVILVKIDQPIVRKPKIQDQIEHSERTVGISNSQIATHGPSMKGNLYLRIAK